MAEKRRLFIYDRKEVGILILLGIGVALFAFTLGVHLGKQVIPKADHEVTHLEEKAPPSSEAAPAAPPNRTEVAEEVRNVPAAVDETLDESLRDEVAETGLRVEKTKPLKLPEQTRPARTREAPVAHAPVTAPSAASPTAHKSRYMIQIGSFPTLKDAEPQLLQLNEKGLRGEIRQATIRGKGKWFRVVFGDYASVAEAEKAGKTYKSEKRIGEFVVVNGSTSPGKN